LKKEETETMRNRWLVCATLAFAVSLLSPTTLVAGDAFAKFGWFFNPDLGGLGNSWFVSAGADWGVFYEEQGFLGLEFQGAYHDESAGGVKVSEVPANVLLNFKWKSPSEKVRPYVGAGVGLISSYVKVEALGDSEHEWVKNAGIQFMGGVELNQKFVVELLAQKAFEGDSADIFAHGSELRWAFLAGIRW
jgi:opacity protein-like surface antigen